MLKKKVEEIVFEACMPITVEHHFELVDVEFIKEGMNWFLRIYIDKPEGVTLDDCQIISVEMGKKLDVLDPISHAYYLEVSSPGLERPLKTERDFEKYKGELVEVKLYKPLEGKKVFKGKLVGRINSKIIISGEGDNELIFESDKVSTTKRIVQF